MNASALTAIRNGGHLTRSIAAFIILTFGGLVTAPAVASTRAEIERQERITPREQSESEQLNATLLTVQEKLRTVAGKPDAIGRMVAQADRKQACDALKSLLTELREQDKAARADFREIENQLKQKNVPAVILDRHEAAVEKYNAASDALLADIQAIANESDDVAIQKRAEKALERLDRQKLQRSHKPFDPDKLPFGIPEKQDLRDPATSPAEFMNITGIEPEFDIERAVASTSDGISGYAVDDYSNPEYLAATPDVQITPEIEALAAELDHSPVKIRNWVRNNIEYLPTYGSIQGAQLTLDNRKGNAFDTASLTIALLRASDIPARYAYGTIEVPTDKLMNWVGGVTDPMAAGNLLGQGGIPHTALASGGEIKAFRLEHVWVEAWVDFHPSRGAINNVGDSWVPMDPSFKQYDYIDGMDLQQQVPFDAETFASDIIDSATLNESEGWVQGVDQALIQNRMEQYRQDVETFINNQDPDTTVGDVIGSKRIIEQDLPILAGTLANKIVATGSRYAELPDNLRYRFRYDLTDPYGSVLASFDASTVDLAGKRLAVSFRPATQADEDLIASYLPEAPEDGSAIDPSELPDSLPGYLINLTVEFTVDGDVVETGPTLTMGTELSGKLGYRIPNKGWDLRPKNIIAGEYQAVGLDLAGIAESQLTTLKDDLEQVRTQLENDDPTGLTRHSLTGNLLQTGVLSYFALNDIQDRMAARASDLTAYRLPSFGTFATSVEPDYYFGVPRNVRFPGVLMDIDYLFNQVADHENQHDDVVTFMRATGPRTSALEHLVPEQLFSTEENPAEGISAVKAIALAQADGQRVYTINAGNLDAALTAVNASRAIESEIRNAVNAGKEVTVHQSPINYYGWSGHGYIIIDPETGAGAYKISGGANGGGLILPAGVSTALTVAGLIIASAVAVALVSALIAIFLIYFVLAIKTLLLLSAIYSTGNLLYKAYNQCSAFGWAVMAGPLAIMIWIHFFPGRIISAIMSILGLAFPMPEDLQCDI